MEAAVFYYTEAASAMQKLFNLNSNPSFKAYVEQYTKRAGRYPKRNKKDPLNFQNVNTFSKNCNLKFD